MRIGVDLGGTKIEAVVLDNRGSVLVRRRVSTPAGDYEGTLSAIVRLIGDLESGVGTSCTVGVGTPGSISPFSGLMRNSNSVALNGRPLDRDLETALGREVRLAACLSDWCWWPPERCSCWITSPTGTSSGGNGGPSSSSP